MEQRGDEWWGLSCFKDEKTPSFSVRKQPPCFFDYSSGIGGNVFTFTRYYYNCSKHEAFEILKKYAGDEEDGQNKRKDLDATIVCKKFRKPKSNSKASNCIILPDNVMQKYEKRQDKLQKWVDEGISVESLDKFQIYYDSFSDRLVYPIRNISGDIVNIGGRTLDPCWKDKNLRKYTYFYNWGTIDTIYGISENIDAIKNKREVILFEGCKSVLIANTWGINNCGAILTSHLNTNQLKILVKLGCRVVFALDKDVNILKDHNIQKLKQYVSVEYLFDTNNLLNEKDSPVDQGLDVFCTLYEHRYIFR